MNKKLTHAVLVNSNKLTIKLSQEDWNKLRGEIVEEIFTNMFIVNGGKKRYARGNFIAMIREELKIRQDEFIKNYI